MLNAVLFCSAGSHCCRAWLPGIGERASNGSTALSHATHAHPRGGEYKRSFTLLHPQNPRYNPYVIVLHPRFGDKLLGFFGSGKKSQIPSHRYTRYGVRADYVALPKTFPSMSCRLPRTPSPLASDLAETNHSQTQAAWYVSFD